MTEDEYRRWRETSDAQENRRVDRLTAFVENDYVSGVYEVIDELEHWPILSPLGSDWVHPPRVFVWAADERSISISRSPRWFSSR